MMKLRAYAKINLGLRVLGKRPDGYHQIETVFHQINLFDEIDLEDSDEVSVLCDSPDVPADSSNLCFRAAELLRGITGLQRGIKITIRKRIPVGGGLGGGSSDAAIVLKGLTGLWRLGISPHELRSLSLPLGSDVPFFIDGGTAYATGRGEILEPLNYEIPHWILVVTPPIHVSTTWAYAQITPRPHPEPFATASELAGMLSQPKRLARHLVNDFESLVMDAYPEIKRAKELLLESGAETASLSGSGSSMYGFFSNERRAKSALLAFPAGSVTSLTEPFFKPEPAAIPAER